MQFSCGRIVDPKFNYSLVSLRIELGGMSFIYVSPSTCGAAGFKATFWHGCEPRSWTGWSSTPSLESRAFFKLQTVQDGSGRGGKNSRRGIQVVSQGGGNNGKPLQAEDVIIVGGGPCGLATALALHKVGIRSLVLEQGESLRETGTALTVWSNGWRALDVLGVSDSLRSQYAEVERVEIMSQDGRVLKGFNLADIPNGPYEARNVERKELLKVLAASLPEGTVQLNSKVLSISQESDGYTQVTLEDGTILRTKILVGSDGLRSVVGKWMKVPEPKFAGQIAIRGVAEFKHNSSRNYMRMLAGQGTRAGYIVTSPTKVYWFVVVTAASRASRITDPALIKQEALSSLKGFPSFVIEAANNTPPENLSRSSLWDRWTFPYRSQVVNGVVLAGDAAHPMTPNLGQGGCCALEDGVVLGRELHRAFDGGLTSASIADSLERFSRLRWERKFPLIVRANIMGQLLQIGLPPVCFVRDNVVFPRLQPQVLTEHTRFDCGELPVVVAH